MLRRNVLIFHQAALGDFVVTWPLAMALSRILPQSRIVYVTHSQKGALAERVLRVESADAEGGWHALHVPPPQVPQLPARSARLLDGAHTIISFRAGDRDGLAAGLLRAAPHAKVVSLDTKHPGRGHVTESLMEQLTEWPALSSAMEQMLRSIAARGAGYHRTPEAGRIIIHPGAGKEANRWPTESFLELARQLRGRGKAVFIVLGEAELQRWGREMIAQFEAVAQVRRPATLIDLLEEIAHAEAFIGNDSGPGHIAGIIGVPTVSLFGPGDPVRWHPLGPSVTVMQAVPIGDIEVAQVAKAVLELPPGA